MKKSKAQGKHDRLCNIIKDELAERGFESVQNVNYNSSTVDGEIDVIGYSNDGKYAIDVEVKCTKHYKSSKKAHEQLDRARKHFPEFKNKRLFTFLAYYKNDGYVMEWYKNHK